MSLEFYCRWGSTVEILYIFKKYFLKWGSNVVGVLRFLELFCLLSSTVSIPAKSLRIFYNLDKDLVDVVVRHRTDNPTH
jgi:hypothetical protein